jgi:site-specific DNA-methyltransferase (adenine-specific)
MGSGTSAAAAILEGFEWRGCEMTKDYLPIIKARTAWATKERKAELAAGKRKAKAKQAKATS